MAYYTKKQTIDNIAALLEKISKIDGAKLLSSPEDISKNITDERDSVPIGWTEKKMLSETAEGINIKSKIFIRIDSDLYTDDAYAIDQYMAVKQGKDVASVIKNNMKLRAAQE